MKEEYVPSKYIEKYMSYLEYERKLSKNTIKSYLNDLKDFDMYFKGEILNVSYDDINTLALPVLRHRIKTNFEAITERITTDNVIDSIIKELNNKPSNLDKKEENNDDNIIEPKETKKKGLFGR